MKRIRMKIQKWVFLIAIFALQLSASTYASPPTNMVPVVGWIRPTNGSSFTAGSTIQLTARATDSEGTVSYVDFFANAMNLGRVFTTPSNSLYNFFWTNAPAGNFELHAE